MEGRPHSAALLVAFAALLIISSAARDSFAKERGDRDLTSYAQTEGQGVNYGAEARSGGAEVVTARRRRASSQCVYTAEPYVWHDNGKTELPPPPEPDAELYKLYCNGEFVRVYWRLARGPDPATVTEHVETMIDRLDVDDKTIDIRPNHAGVVAVPAYYWVDGYDGGPVTETETIAGTPIVVTARLTHVEWDFGDDTPAQHGGLGQPWPERSDVRHSYRYASSAEEPYVVTATLWFQPTFTVDGQPGTDLDPFPVSFSRPYWVREIQAVQHH